MKILTTNLLQSIMKVFAASVIGSFVGTLTALLVVSAFAAMILNEIFNVYYATIFFIVGSYYSFNIFKKS
jgi:ABC-type nitrate/sulfonate/bicarbonate transport system permease component